MSSIQIVLPGESLTLNPESSGFAHGYALFETIRLREGRIELWEAHWQRLTGSARKLGIACPFHALEVLETVKTLARELSAQAILKLSLLKEGNSSKLLIYSRALHALPEEVGLLMECPVPIHEGSPLAGHKTHNYLENLLALEAARALGCFDALRVNSKGHVAEGALSNIFFHRDGNWHTPAPQSGLLPGVIREELVQAIAVEQGIYLPADVLTADAVFLSNASIGLQPVDWLLSAGKKIQLRSRQHDSYEPALRLLRERIEATAVEV